MIDELLEDVARRRSDAQERRRQGRKENDPQKRAQLFRTAADEFQSVIAVLERGLRALRREQSGYTHDVCSVLEMLSQSYGSLGGTWRDARNLVEAKKQYDKGNEYEEERRQNCSASDSYNMLQRLIVPLLEKPSRLREPAFIADLDTVRQEIERQVAAGRSDSWALADLALARFLCGIEADAATADLEKRVAEGTFYESAHSVIAALIEEGLGKDDALGKRLDHFKQLLQRKGGFKGGR